MEVQQATTLDQAMQLGHDMVLAQSAIVKGLSFRSFALDLPTDGQQVYVIDSGNVISTGAFALGALTVTPSGHAAITTVSLSGWAAIG